MVHVLRKQTTKRKRKGMIKMMKMVLKIKGLGEQVGEVVEENEMMYVVKTENDEYVILKNHNCIEYEIINDEKDKLKELVKKINKTNHPATIAKLWYFTNLVETGKLEATMENYKAYTKKQLKEMLEG